MKSTLHHFIVVNNAAFIIVPFVVFMILMTNFLFGRFEREITANNQVIATTIAGQLEDQLQIILSMLNQIDVVILHDKEPAFEQSQMVLDQLRKNSSFFESIEIIGSDGKTELISPYKESFIGLDRSGMDFYRQAKGSGTVCWSSTTISAATGEPTLSLALPASQGYVIIGNLNLGRITDISQQIADNFAERIRVVVVDRQGYYISNPDRSKVRQREIADIYNMPGEKIGDDSTYLVEKDGLSYMLSSAVVKGQKWTVFVEQPYATTLAPLKRAQYVFLCLVIITIILATGYAAYRFTGIAKELDRLNEKAEAIAGGNYLIQADDSRYLEISKLAKRFNKMGEAIRKRDFELNRLAFFDSITGLPNRHSLFDELRNRIVQSQGRAAASFMLVMIDIDDFKDIINILGRDFGEKALNEIGAKLRDFMPEAFLAHIESDEFIYLLNYPQQVQIIDEFVGKLMALFDQQIVIDSVGLFARVSIGIVFYPDNGKDELELLRNLDIAMAKARQHQGNSYAYFSKEMHDKIVKQRIVEGEMRKSIHKKSEFFQVFQPQIAARTGFLRGFEVLVRWNNPQMGILNPVDFIPVAERSGLIIPLGYLILDEGCRIAALLNEKYDKNLIFSFNISAVQIQQPDFIEMVLSTLSKHKLSPKLLEIEITESVFLESRDIMSVLYKIRENGIKISLDDFGTGYSSLSKLKDLPIDTLKIDNSFVKALDNFRTSGQIVSAIILLGHTLGLEVIAEGVETQESNRKLKEYGCDTIQGYYYAQPMKYEELTAYIEA